MHVEAIAATPQGKVRGRLSHGGYVFKGIPYAAAPFGAHRFLRPQPVEPWGGVRDALAFGPKPPQLPYPPPLDVLFPEGRATMRFDTRSGVVENPRSEVQALWDERSLAQFGRSR